MGLLGRQENLGRARGQRWAAKEWAKRLDEVAESRRGQRRAALLKPRRAPAKRVRGLIELVARVGPQNPEIVHRGDGDGQIAHFDCPLASKPKPVGRRPRSTHFGREGAR